MHKRMLVDVYTYTYAHAYTYVSICTHKMWGGCASFDALYWFEGNMSTSTRRDLDASLRSEGREPQPTTHRRYASHVSAAVRISSAPGRRKKERPPCGELRWEDVQVQDRAKLVRPRPQAKERQDHGNASPEHLSSTNPHPC